MPKVGCLKYLLVIVGHLTNWVEAIPLSSATANNVTKILLEVIITQFGIIENIDSDNGSHFTENIIRELVKILGIKWKYHAPWHPPSSGKTEKMNQTLRRHLTKLILETRLPWTKCLPIAFLRIQTTPRRNIGLSSYELLYGLPYLSGTTDLPTFETKDQFLKNYILGLSSTLSTLRQQGFLAQTLSLEFQMHPYRPEDHVLIKFWKEGDLELAWEGAYQVLLTTETAIRAAERGWAHYTRVKSDCGPPYS